MIIFTQGCQKTGISYINDEQTGSVIYWGLIIFLAALKMGAIRHAHAYYVIYR